jgi:ParB-like chromosome segregation protein Spo0J
MFGMTQHAFLLNEAQQEFLLIREELSQLRQQNKMLQTQIKNLQRELSRVGPVKLKSRRRLFSDLDSNEPIPTTSLKESKLSPECILDVKTIPKEIQQQESESEIILKPNRIIVEEEPKQSPCSSKQSPISSSKLLEKEQDPDSFFPTLEGTPPSKKLKSKSTTTTTTTTTVVVPSTIYNIQKVLMESPFSGPRKPHVRSPKGPASPQEYRCRDCKRAFCRRGDRDNHERKLGHLKWQRGASLRLPLKVENV